MKEGSRNEAYLSEGTPCGGPGGRAPLLGTPKDMLKRYINRDVKCPVSGYLSPQGPSWGTQRGFTCRTFFLDPQDIKILSLGATWNFGIGTGLS
jgi:hypothetical protein